MPAPLYPRIRCERERLRHTPGPHRAPPHPPSNRAPQAARLPICPPSPLSRPRTLPPQLSESGQRRHLLPTQVQQVPPCSFLPPSHTAHTLVSSPGLSLQGLFSFSSPGLSLQGLFSCFSKPKEQQFYKPPQPPRGPEGSPLLKQALCLHQAAPPHPPATAFHESCSLCKPIKGQISDEMAPPQLLQSELTPPAILTGVTF